MSSSRCGAAGAFVPSICTRVVVGEWRRDLAMTSSPSRRPDSRYPSQDAYCRPALCGPRLARRNSQSIGKTILLLEAETSRRTPDGLRRERSDADIQPGGWRSHRHRALGGASGFLAIPSCTWPRVTRCAVGSPSATSRAVRMTARVRRRSPACPSVTDSM
jgi:hypothetical protein